MPLKKSTSPKNIPIAPGHQQCHSKQNRRCPPLSKTMDTAPCPTIIEWREMMVSIAVAHSISVS